MKGFFTEIKIENTSQHKRIAQSNSNPTLQRRVEEKCEETALVAVLLEGGRDVLHNAITDRTHIHSIPCLT